ncbi:hypothetical protein ACFWIO_17250 [Streptomyces diastatochromogenes]|uniref:hypothetical protein n=1 Tax=Streptomyces diastatochromogenes TaxID=42236 RepID=UPI003664DE8F
MDLLLVVDIGRVRPGLVQRTSRCETQVSGRSPTTRLTGVASATVVSTSFPARLSRVTTYPSPSFASSAGTGTDFFAATGAGRVGQPYLLEELQQALKKRP